ncbi:MAG: O-succinylbenzoate--CoA ligase [Crocinitomicaceae bacterium]|nr:O-succinylbenzoate--CoA ligase [Crocinitomicaceae bacterium]
MTKDETLISKTRSFVEEWNSDDPFFMAKTSGSTGIPKNTRLEKKYALQSVFASQAYFHFDRMKTMGLCLSPDTIGGKMQLLRAMAFGLEILVFDNERNPLKNLDRELDFVTLVPLQVQAILDETPEKPELCRKILIGGAKVPLQLAEKLRTFSTEFFESYGMTETYSHVAIKKLNSSTAVFEAVGDIRFSSRDGNLVIHAPLLGIDSLPTNDSVELLDERRFRLLGRSDFAINSGGYKFHPELLEQKLEGRIPVNYFIIGEADAEFGECVTLYLEMDYSTEMKQRVEETLAASFGRYEKPKKIYFLREFVKTESGKINRLASQKSALER